MKTIDHTNTKYNILLELKKFRAGANSLIWMILRLQVWVQNYIGVEMLKLKILAICRSILLEIKL